MERPKGLDIQKTQHTSTNSVSIRSHASQALSTSVRRPIVSVVDDDELYSIGFGGVALDTRKISQSEVVDAELDTTLNLCMHVVR